MIRLSEFFAGVPNISANAEYGIMGLEVDAPLATEIVQLQGRLPSYTFAIVTRGWATILYNGQEWTLRPNDLYSYTPGYTISVIGTSDDYHAVSLLADYEIMLETNVVRDLLRAAYFPFVELHEPQLTLTEEQAHDLCRQIRGIIHRQEGDHQFKAEVLRALFSAFLFDLLDIQSHSIKTLQTSERAEEIFISFVRLLSQHFLTEHNIPFYADKLCVSPIYLSRVVKQVSGGTVVDYINQMLLMEASWLLQNTDETTTQIADHLHFSSQASFCRFFTRMKGMSPKQYRANPGGSVKRDIIGI